MPTITMYLPDAAATEAMGARLAPALEGGMIVTLDGDLGTGKTTLVRGCLRALGWTRSVKSPSYSLLENYTFSRLYFYHFDFFRFTDPNEWDTAGLRDCFRADAVCLVEWPTRIADRLPRPDLEIALSHPDDPEQAGRRIALRARSAAGKRCVSTMTAVAGLARS